MAVHERTRKWISKAIAIHGDLYDYSETEYISTKDPISFICRIHGKVTIPQAGIHLRKIKPGGCQQCGWEKIRKHGFCKDCGAQTSNKKMVRCESCSQSKKKEIDAKRTKKCKTCGSEYKGDPRSAFCSNNCYRSYREIHDPLIKINCVICGEEKQIRLKQKSSNNCCSKECSTILLKKNQGHPYGRRTPEERGRINRDRYRRKRSKERRLNSIGYRFWLKCKSKSLAFKEKDPWKTRCIAASVSLSKRFSYEDYGSTNESRKGVTWKQVFDQSIRGLSTKTQDKWTLRITNAKRLLTQRERRRPQKNSNS